MVETMSMTEAIRNATAGLKNLQQDTISETELMILMNSLPKLRGFLAAYATFEGTLNQEQETCLGRALVRHADEVGNLLVKNCIMAGTAALAYRAQGDKEQEANSLAVLAKIEKLAASLSLSQTAQAKAEALEAIKNPTSAHVAASPWKLFFERWIFSERQLLEIVPFLEKL